LEPLDDPRGSKDCPTIIGVREFNERTPALKDPLFEAETTVTTQLARGYITGEFRRETLLLARSRPGSYHPTGAPPFGELYHISMQTRMQYHQACKIC
jgi:hypothetical protein